MAKDFRSLRERMSPESRDRSHALAERYRELMADEKKIPPPLTPEELKEKLKNVKPGRIVMADTTEIKKAWKSVDRVLVAIGEILVPGDAEDWVKYVFVSDESTVGDFLHDPAELAKLSEALGFPVTEKSYIKDVALRSNMSKQSKAEWARKARIR